MRFNLLLEISQLGLETAEPETGVSLALAPDPDVLFVLLTIFGSSAPVSTACSLILINALSPAHGTQ